MDKLKPLNTEDYIAQFPKWKKQLEAAQKVLDDSDLKATIKWGAPCYTYKGKNLIGLAGFKNHCAIWFHKGSLLSDKAGVFENAQPDKTKYLRQLRFRENEEVDIALLQSYIQEAIALEDLEKTTSKSPIPSKRLILSKELKAAFNDHPTLEKHFRKLSLSSQREYSAYIDEAKRETTKARRLDKIIPMIKLGKTLHDKYKN